MTENDVVLNQYNEVMDLTKEEDAVNVNDLFTTEDIAQILKYSVQKVRRLISLGFINLYQGKVEGAKRQYITQAEFNRFVAYNENCDSEFLSKKMSVANDSVMCRIVTSEGTIRTETSPSWERLYNTGKISFVFEGEPCQLKFENNHIHLNQYILDGGEKGLKQSNFYYLEFNISYNFINIKKIDDTRYVPLRNKIIQILTKGEITTKELWNEITASWGKDDATRGVELLPLSEKGLIEIIKFMGSDDDFVLRTFEGTSKMNVIYACRFVHTNLIDMEDN